jgi:two-component sensor histidine kinase
VWRAWLRTSRSRLGGISRGSLAAYFAASFFVALAGAIRWAIGLLGPEAVPFATFYPATFFATIIGGAGPGIFAALSGGVFAWWAFLPSYMAFVPLSAGLAVYVVSSLLIVWGGEHYLKLTKRLQREEEFRMMAVEELSHRLKNKVASILAIVSYQLRDHPDLSAEISNRLVALSRTDNLILASQGRGAGLRNIVTTELEPYDLSRIAIAGPDYFLAPTHALTMALVIHELATNAAKYGALSMPDGKLSVLWSISERKLKLEWRETNGPFVSGPTHRGFGLRLLPRALDQFDGSIQTNFEATGLICKIEATLPAPLQSTTAVINPTAA